MTTIVKDKPKRKTASEIAREVTELIGVGIKTGATLPLRNAISLLEPLIKGEYNGGPRAEKPRKKKAKKQDG